MITIQKTYGENINYDKYNFVKIELTLKSDKILNTPEEVEEHSNKLLILAKKLVKKEIKQTKEEFLKEKEEQSNG
jgi:hypothetical protein